MLRIKLCVVEKDKRERQFAIQFQGSSGIHRKTVIKSLTSLMKRVLRGRRSIFDVCKLTIESTRMPSTYKMMVAVSPRNFHLAMIFHHNYNYDYIMFYNIILLRIRFDKVAECISKQARKKKGYKRVSSIDHIIIMLSEQTFQSIWNRKNWW